MLIDVCVCLGRYDVDVAYHFDLYETVRIAKSKGLDGIVLVEKNRLWPIAEIQAINAETEDFVLFRGQEVECPEGSVIVIGCDEEIPNQSSSLELYSHVQSLGGCAFFMPGNSLLSEEPLHRFSSSLPYVFQLFDGAVVYNSRLSKGSLRDFFDYGRQKHLCALGGSASSTAGLYVTKFFDRIADEEDFVEAVKQRRLCPCVLEGHNIDPRGGQSRNISWSVPKGHIMKCRGLLFDLYGTLVDLRSNESHEEFDKMAWWLSLEGIQVSGKNLMYCYRECCSELYNQAIGAVAFPEVDILKVFRKALLIFAGRDFEEDFIRRSALIFRSLTIKSIAVYPYTRVVLRELKRRGYRMGLISNGQSAFTVPEIEDLKLLGFFDFVVLSSDVGYGKPDYKIYEMAANQLELPPEETAFIGDDLHGDVYAPQQLGFQTVYMKTNVGTSNFPVTPSVTLTDGDLRNLLRIFP